jgi:HPt (histidine-containing phosphotransfer) domain-containing protein
MSTDIIEQMRATFRAEALDLLIELDSALLSLEADPGDSTLVHRVFRAIHTIKGSGATAGFAHLSKFAHKVEEAFDLARKAGWPHPGVDRLRAESLRRYSADYRGEGGRSVRPGRGGGNWRVHAAAAGAGESGPETRPGIAERFRCPDGI